MLPAPCLQQKHQAIQFRTLDVLCSFHCGRWWCDEPVPAKRTDQHERLGTRLQSAGFALEERTYRPHVTLARHAEGVALPDAIQPITMTAERFTMVESTGDRAARYLVQIWLGGL